MALARSSFQSCPEPLCSSSKFYCSRLEYSGIKFTSFSIFAPFGSNSCLRIHGYRTHRNRIVTPDVKCIGSGGGDGRGSTMQRIVEKLKNSRGLESKRIDRRGIEHTGEDAEGNSEEDFYEEGVLQTSILNISHGSSLQAETKTALTRGRQVLFPWEKPKEEQDEEKAWTARSKSRTFLAELTLPDSELRRLRNLMFQIKSKVRIKGSGVSDEVVSTIHEKWSSSELVRIKVDGSLALNMKRVHETLERKTGGLVIWRSGTSISLYRGVSYEVPSFKQEKKIYKKPQISDVQFRSERYNIQEHDSSDEIRDLQPYSEEVKDMKIHQETDYEEEVDKLLEEIGPRYKDWPGCDPQPVDADLLPGVVPGFQSPLRVLPYGVRPSLSQKDATSLRRLAKSLPPHFALGRSRQLEGLAMAMIKLWEKVSIAKIALKRGVQITTSERMAEDLKNLTGGMILSRTKDFLVFYRGKNFLSPEISEVFAERERLANSFQDNEEQARLQASPFVIPKVEVKNKPLIAGTLDETLNANMKWGTKVDDFHEEKIMQEAAIARHNRIVHKLQMKLASAQRRLDKAGEALSKVEAFLKPTGLQADPDSITDEERFMFRKLGLRMKAFLLLGRRGVFDGTVENMHLHWKYRELIKIVLKAKTFDHVKKIALALEAESGGVLVSVDKISKGYAIVVFRGKDYFRPSTIRPKNLLTKRKALARSIEIQRREALTKHAALIQSQIEKLTSEIENMNFMKDKRNNELYDKLESTYKTEDEESEDGDDAYLETYIDDNEINFEDGDFESEADEDNANLESEFCLGEDN